MRSSKNDQQPVNSTELKPNAAQTQTKTMTSHRSEVTLEHEALSPNHKAVKSVFDGNGNAAALLHIFALSEIIAAQKHDKLSAQNHGLSS